MGSLRATTSLPAPLRDALASGAVVVTPNNRLARRVAALYDEAQRASGRAVWPAANVLPWSAWLERLWQDALATEGQVNPPLLVRAVQSAHLWTTIVSADGAPLVDVRGAAALAAQAWTLAHAWGSGGPSWRAWAGGDDDCAAFARWAERYAAILARTGAIDVAQLPDWLVQQLPASGAVRGVQIVLAGFVEVSPQQERLVAALVAAGADVARVATTPEHPASDPVRASRAVAATPRDEVVAALRWARELAQADPRATIGVAIADLAPRRDEVRALAEEILCPALQWPGNEGAPRPYNLSLGTPAADVPLIAAARGLIALAHAPMTSARAAALLRSPYIAGEDGWHRRAALEVAWLKTGTRDVSLDDALSALYAVDRDLAERWRAARDALRMPASASPRDWAETWRTWLAATGWPGTRALSSAEWQARAAWDELLAQFATLSVVAKRLSRADALAALDALVQRAVFQPEAAAAQVQILGLLEATGLPLDALWVAGLTSESWPPAPLPNPLLALRWQREHNAPRASAARELDYATLLTAHWALGAPQVVFSYAQTVDDHPCSPSPLMPDAPLQPADATPRTTARMQFDAAPWPAQSLVADDLAPPIPVGAAIRGGAGLVEAQGDCPFRAMSLYRLRGEPWPLPPDGLSPGERGELVHAALSLLWRDVGGHRDFVALPPEALAARIATAATRALAIVRPERWRALPALVREGEGARIASLLADWLDRFERDRPPFKVVGTEVSASLVLGGLELRLRIDRIDAQDDGGTIVIDYKTGFAKSPQQWFAPRPEAPQLGLYTLALSRSSPPQTVRGVAFAQLVPGEIRVHGIAADPGVWTALVVPAAIPGAGLADWTALVARWDASLDALATEIRDGRAEVAPRDPVKTCRYCGLQPFCRIGEQLIGTRGGAGDG